MKVANWSLDDKRSLACAITVAVVVALTLTVLVTAPRGRLNVMQGVAVLFFALVLRQFARASGADSLRPSPDSSRPPLLLFTLGVILAGVVWASGLHSYFINDDFTLLPVTRPFSLDLIGKFFRSGDGGTFYRPLTYVTYSIDQAFWGEAPVGYHVTNLLLHAASTAALAVLVGQLGGSRRSSFMTAGVFAAMPVQVEAVTWMSGRFDVLCTTTALWTVVSYLWARAKGGTARYTVAVAMYALAICAKETAFVIPLLLIGVEVVGFRNFSLRSFPWQRLAGFFVAGAIMFTCRWWALGGFGGYRSGGASTMTGVGWKTLEALFLRGPSILLLGFNWTQPPGFVLFTAALTAGLLVFLGIRTTLSERGRRIGAFGAVWMIIAMGPGHFLLSIGPGLSNTRILCLASAGMALLLGQLVSALAGNSIRNIAYAALVGLFSLGVLHNLAAWRWTSSIGEGLLQEVVRLEPAPPKNAQIVISRLPGTIRGVFFFGAGLKEGVRMAYDRDDITAFRDAASTLNSEHPEIHFTWSAETNALSRE